MFRRVGNREDLMGDALWYMADRTMTAAVRDWETAHGTAVRDPDGELRCLAVMRRYCEAIATNQGFRRLLDDEPTFAIRVLTDPHGRVQPHVMAAHVELLRRDIEEAAASDEPLLLSGPPGSDHEAVARAVHHQSARGSRAMTRSCSSRTGRRTMCRWWMSRR